MDMGLKDQTESKGFYLAWNRFASGVYETAVEKGWHDTDVPEGDPNYPFHMVSKLGLIAVETAEAVQAFRSGNPMDEKIGLPSLAVELADTVIRIMDLDYEMKIGVANAIVEKARYNKTRPYKHGKIV